MPAVGAYLRELRERQGVSLDEISRSTRVLHHYLEALETDNLAGLPAPVFAKGFIRAYCQALGVSPDEAIALYEQRTGQSRAPAPSLLPPPRPAPAPRPAPPPPPPLEHHAPAPAAERRESRSRGTVLISFVLLVVLGAALFAVTLALQSGRDEVDPGAAVHVAAPATPASTQTPAPEPAQSEPAPPPQPLVAPQPQKQLPTTQSSAAPIAGTPSAAPPVGTPRAVPPAPAAPPVASAIASPYRLVARTTESTWMRVRTEDGRTSEETIPANEVREWVSNGPFVLTIGNAGGVSLELNGRPVPRLGASGAVISRMVLPPDVQ